MTWRWTGVGICRNCCWGKLRASIVWTKKRRRSASSFHQEWMGYKYIYIYICMYVFMYVCNVMLCYICNVCMYVMYVLYCIVLYGMVWYVCMYVCIYMYMYICIYIYTCTYIYVYIYIYTYIMYVYPQSPAANPQTNWRFIIRESMNVELECRGAVQHAAAKELAFSQLFRNSPRHRHQNGFAPENGAVASMSWCV